MCAVLCKNAVLVMLDEILHKCPYMECSPGTSCFPAKDLVLFAAPVSLVSLPMVIHAIVICCIGRMQVTYIY